MSYRACMSCEQSVDVNEATALKLIKEGQTLAVLCESCQESVKTLKITLTKDNKNALFTATQFMCVDTFENDDYQKRIESESTSFTDAQE